MTNDDAIETSGPEPADAVADRTSPKRGGCVVGCLFGGVIFYFLSPLLYVLVLYQIYKLGWDETAASMEIGVDVIYAPIIWLIEHVPAVETFYDWYMSLIEDFIP